MPDERNEEPNALPYPGVSADRVRKSATWAVWLIGLSVLLSLYADARGVADTGMATVLLLLSTISVAFVERLAKALANVEHQVHGRGGPSEENEPSHKSLQPTAFGGG